MKDEIFIPNVGTFKLIQRNYQREIQFQNRIVPVRIYPKSDGSAPHDGWAEVMGQLFNRFVERGAQELKAELPGNVRTLCRDYEMYDGLPIPWTDAELIDGLQWHDIKLCDFKTPGKYGIPSHRFVECCTEPTLEKLNNFSLLFAFDEKIKFNYVHFDG